MLASFKSDYYLLRGYFKTLLGVFAFVIAISVFQGNAYMANFYPSFMAVYMPFSLFALGEQSGWESMLLSAPVTRNAIVGGRYLMCLAVDLAGLLIGFAATMFIEPYALFENVAALLFTMVIVFMLNAVMLPIIYKFGTHKSRFVLMAFCLLPAIALPISDAIDCRPFADAFVRLLESLPALLALDLGALALLGVSCLISRAIYQRKEF